MMEFSVKTSEKEELVDITAKVQEIVEEGKVKEGLCVVYCPHTTAAVTINENADPSVQGDILASLDDIVKDIGFSHMEGNSPSHVKSSLVGCSETILVGDGKLKLGPWQGIFFCEFDGPRKRKVYMRVLG